MHRFKFKPIMRTVCLETVLAGSLTALTTLETAKLESETGALIVWKARIAFSRTLNLI